MRSRRRHSVGEQQQYRYQRRQQRHYQTTLFTALSFLSRKHRKLALRLVLRDATHVSSKLLEHESGLEGLEKLLGCGQTEGMSFTLFFYSSLCFSILCAVFKIRGNVVKGFFSPEGFPFAIVAVTCMYFLCFCQSSLSNIRLA